VNVAVEGAAGAAGVLADTAQTRNLGVSSGHAETRHRIKDRATLLLRASVTCFVYVFNLGPDGKMTALVPNVEAPQLDNRLRANVARRMPQSDDGFELEFEPPAGVETVYVVATLEPWPEWLQPFVAGDARELYRALTLYLEKHAQRRGLATCVHKFRSYDA
jgi:hypothetical protein